MISWENESDKTIAATVALNSRHGPHHDQDVALLIGPEGGFTESEIQDAQSINIMPVTLGKRILRAETAAIVAAALTLYELGEMN